MCVADYNVISNQFYVYQTLNYFIQAYNNNSSFVWFVTWHGMAWHCCC